MEKMAKSLTSPLKHYLPEDLAAANAEIESTIYAASGLFEDLEHKGLVRGNGHHIRQRVAAFAAGLMAERWKGSVTCHDCGDLVSRLCYSYDSERKVHVCIDCRGGMK